MVIGVHLPLWAAYAPRIPLQVTLILNALEAVNRHDFPCLVVASQDRHLVREHGAPGNQGSGDLKLTIPAVDHVSKGHHVCLHAGLEPSRDKFPE